MIEGINTTAGEANPVNDATPADDHDHYNISRIGYEFEYPIAADPDAAPATAARRSRRLRSSIPSRWDIGVGEPGRAGREHTGVEIRTGILDLHSDQPEEWYVRTIEELTNNYNAPFAACGYGDTNFGLHFHIDQLLGDSWEQLCQMVTEPWAPVFFCASVRPDDADPWRRGGVNNQCFVPIEDQNATRPITPGHSCGRGPRGHYEFRLPEPGLPDHVSMMFHFFRIFEVEGADAARDYARTAVLSKDPRLTPIQQFRAFNEWYDDFPQRALDSGPGSTARARYFAREVMGDEW